VRGYVAVTDPDWLRRLAARGVREANFWQPRPSPLRLERGTPWIFKVRGTNLVGGYGFFTYRTEMPAGVAWETFGPANGVESFEELLRRIASLRHGATGDDTVGCVVLSDVTVLDERNYVPAPIDWKPQTQLGRYDDLDHGDAARVWSELVAASPPAVGASPLLSVPGGFGKPAVYLPRLGQGAFRLMVMDAYDRRCAITGERTLPALDAAHIRPFRERESHEVQNGILMRSDIHRLFDQGYVTVTPDLRFRVSPQIRDQFNNGIIYYDLDQRPVRVPEVEEQKPDVSALEWHSTSLYRG